MLSAIISTHEFGAEPGADPCRRWYPLPRPGCSREVVIADAGSRDATADVADIAGCRFIKFDRGARGPPQGRRSDHAQPLVDVSARRGRAAARLDRRSRPFHPDNWRAGRRRTSSHISPPRPAPMPAPGLCGASGSRARCDLAAVQGPNRVCSSPAAYTMRSVGIPQEMMPRPLSCTGSAAGGLWCCPLRSRYRRYLTLSTNWPTLLRHGQPARRSRPSAASTASTRGRSACCARITSTAPTRSAKCACSTRSRKTRTLHRKRHCPHARPRYGLSQPPPAQFREARADQPQDLRERRAPEPPRSDRARP